MSLKRRLRKVEESHKATQEALEPLQIELWTEEQDEMVRSDGLRLSMADFEAHYQARLGPPGYVHTIVVKMPPDMSEA